MKPTLRNLAAILLRADPPSSARLSFVVGKNQRQVQYWLSGRDPTPDEVLEDVEDQIAAVEEFGLESRMQQLIDEAGQAGIKDPVLVHYLEVVVEKLKKKGNNP